MPEYHYEFELILAGTGPNRDEAWENAVESFVQDPGETPPLVHREQLDVDCYPDEPEDTTPIEGNNLREFVELVARMMTDEEFGDEGMSGDDATETLSYLIVSARHWRNNMTIDITVKTDPEVSFVQGRNGRFKLNAIHVHSWTYPAKKIFLDGVGQRGHDIKGGFEINTRAFAKLCQKFLAAYVAGGGTFDDLVDENGEKV